MLKFVGDRTAVPYFSNLVWFIGNHVLEIDQCMRKEIKDQQMLIRLDDLVAEHLDHLHYLNDILRLQIHALNQILTDHLLNRLLIPLYIYSLVTESPSPATESTRPRISSIVSLFLLSQVFLIISYESLVQQLVNIILNAKCSIFDKPQFEKPIETLEESLCNNLTLTDYDETVNEMYEEKASAMDKTKIDSDDVSDGANKLSDAKDSKLPGESKVAMEDLNHRQLQEMKLQTTDESPSSDIFDVHPDSISSETIGKLICNHFYDERPFLKALFEALESAERDDHSSIFSLCLIYAIVFNAGKIIKKKFFSFLH